MNLKKSVIFAIIVAVIFFFIFSGSVYTEMVEGIYGLFAWVGIILTSSIAQLGIYLKQKMDRSIPTPDIHIPLYITIYFVCLSVLSHVGILGEVQNKLFIVSSIGLMAYLFANMEEIYRNTLSS